LVEVLKQPQYQPVPVEKQVVIIYAATNGFLDPVEVDQVSAYQSALFQFLDTRRAQLLTSLAEKKQIDDQIKADLNQTLKEFGESFAAGRKTAA
jgi:F-type H+-transporting ATPase subunit alpha